jgi:hypothetical protein
MSRAIPTRFVWLAFLAVAMVGCHSASAPLPGEVNDGTTPQAAVAKPAEPPTAKPAPTPTVAAQTRTARPFTPPFPDRSDLFQPPHRVESKQPRSNTTEGLVELKGFVNVDEPRVVLSIDGAITPLPEGGEKYGVQVISIKPPSVVLQRGRNRWTASLD